MTARGAAPPFVLVTGGKGGVGKTTIAANLALAFGQLGLRPLLADLDFGLANLDVVLGERPAHTVQAFLHGERTLAQCLHGLPGGVRLLSAGSGCYRDGRPDALRRARLLAALSESAADLIVGDSPSGIGAEVLDFAARARRVLVVTTPDPAALTDAYGVIKALDSFGRDLGREVPTPEVFVNLARDAGEAAWIVGKLAGVCERFLVRRPRLVGWMPRNRAALRAVSEQRPFVLHAPESTAARCVERLARRYLDLVADAPARDVERPEGGDPSARALVGHGG